MWKFCRLYYMFMLKFSKYHSSKKTLVEIKIFPRKFHKFWHLWPRIVMPFMKIKLCCHNFPHQRFWKTIFSNSLSLFLLLHIHIWNPFSYLQNQTISGSINFPQGLQMLFLYSDNYTLDKIYVLHMRKNSFSNV